jgi:hypothetical protein
MRPTIVKTEEVLYPPDVIRQVVSPALQELAPVEFHFLDSRRNPVLFSSAGYVLRPGSKYYLQVVLADDPDLDKVELATPPDYVRTQQQEQHQKTVFRRNDDGNRVYEIQFRVERGLRSIDIEADALDLEFSYTSESGKPRQQLQLPIVIRPGVRFLLLSAGTALLAFWIPIWISDSGIKPEDAANLAKVQSLFFSPLPWVLAGLIVCGVAALYIYVFLQLQSRARDLWRDFQSYCKTGEQSEEESSASRDSP